MRCRWLIVILMLLVMPTLLLAQEETPSEDGGLPRHESGQFLYNYYSDVFVVNGDGTGTINLTDSISSEACASWLPDGNRILFEGVVSGQSLHRLFTMNADGSDIQRLTTVGLSLINTILLKPSADGTQVIWQTVSISEEGERSWQAVDVVTGNLREIDAIEASRLLSPNGLGLTNDRDDVYAVDADGNQTLIASNSYLVRWSPDGDLLSAIINDPDTSLQGIAIGNRDGSNFTTILPPNYLINEYAWSPDGTQLGLIITNPNDPPENFTYYLATLDIASSELNYLSEGASLEAGLWWGTQSRLTFFDSNILGDQINWYMVDLTDESLTWFVQNASECDTLRWRP